VRERLGFSAKHGISCLDPGDILFLRQHGSNPVDIDRSYISNFYFHLISFPFIAFPASPFPSLDYLSLAGVQPELTAEDHDAVPRDPQFEAAAEDHLLHRLRWHDHHARQYENSLAPPSAYSLANSNIACLANDHLTDHHGFGFQNRRQGNLDTLNGKVECRDSFRSMLESWKLSFPECIPIVCETIKLDPHFAEFYDWSVENNVPVIVLSLGMVPIIRALLQHLLGEDKGSKIEIVANMPIERPPINDLNVRGGWTIQYRDDSGFGHDKSLTIRPYAEAIAKMPRSEQPTLLYAGDGVSDLSAARETDLLFAKKGHDLVSYCEREGVPFTLFEGWSDILRKTKEILEGRSDVRMVAEEVRKEAQRDPEKAAEINIDEAGKTETVR